MTNTRTLKLYAFFSQQCLNAWRPHFSPFGWVSFSILFLPVKPVYWVSGWHNFITEKQKTPSIDLPLTWWLIHHRRQNMWAQVLRTRPLKPLGQTIYAFGCFTELDVTFWKRSLCSGSRKIAEPQLETEFLVWDSNMATVMRCFSRQHPSWPSWINYPTCRTWKLLSFLLCLLPVLSESWVTPRHVELGAQNWFSNNSGFLLQVLSAFLPLRYRRVLQERKHSAKGDTAKPALQKDGVQVLLLLLAFAVCSIHSRDKPKLDKRSKLLHLHPSSVCL